MPSSAVFAAMRGTDCVLEVHSRNAGVASKKAAPKIESADGSPGEVPQFRKRNLQLYRISRGLRWPGAEATDGWS